jgi:syntaxin 1B/2/3
VVRARHNDIQRIEATVAQLAAMFQDMSRLVDEQEHAIVHTEESTIKATTDLENSGTQLRGATDLARHRNKLKWWCLLIVVIIIIAIAVILAVIFGRPHH